MASLHVSSSFCVSVSGFVPPGPLCASLLTPSAPYTTPTLHIMGKNDILVVEERSKALLEVSAKKRVEVHDGGSSHLSTLLIIIYSFLFRIFISTSFRRNLFLVFVFPALFIYLFMIMCTWTPNRSLRTLQGKLAQLLQSIPQTSPRR